MRLFLLIPLACLPPGEGHVFLEMYVNIHPLEIKAERIR